MAKDGIHSCPKIVFKRPLSKTSSAQSITPLALAKLKKSTESWKICDAVNRWRFCYISDSSASGRRSLTFEISANIEFRLLFGNARSLPFYIAAEYDLIKPFSAAILDGNISNAIRKNLCKWSRRAEKRSIRIKPISLTQ